MKRWQKICCASAPRSIGDSLMRQAALFVLIYFCLTSQATLMAETARWFDIEHPLSSQTSQRGNTVVSINLCADQLVMLLARPENILSLSNLSHHPEGSYFYKKAQQFPTTRGEAESILSLAPDLVIAGQYTTRHTVSLLRELGVRVEILPIANSIDMMLSNVQSVARWLGVETRAERIVDMAKKRLERLDPGDVESPKIAVFDPNGYTVGANTLRGDMISRSAWSNAASLAGIESYGKLSLESLVLLSPDALLDSPYSPDTYSRAQQVTSHPAISAAGLNPLVISVPSREMMCAGPWTVDVVERLNQARHRLNSNTQRTPR